MRGAFDWLFRNRETGGVTIGQWPNAPLLIWMAATAVRFLLDPQGDVAGALDIAATVALTWWAVDEVVRGVNPFRRMLGGAVLAGIVFRLATG